MTATLHVVARISARPDTVAQTQTLLQNLLEPTRREPGCLRYTLLRNHADPTDFTFVEEWADQAALDAHLASPHIQAALVEAASLLAAPPDIRPYALVG
ncbi:MAG: putative quinol monooxygenase [Candidatus Contendobacter sp.]|nr:putative quinol monooxygenase [Candidatus Contendobacter sp.]MDG4556884.1 putative quinol monooxygenase [Candidatus Contendobacter sp.]